MPYLTRSTFCRIARGVALHYSRTHVTVAALDGKGKALLPGHEVRELVWNIQYHPTHTIQHSRSDFIACCSATCNTSARNHPNATNRSDSLETLFKAITHTRSIDDKRVTDAFGPCLPAFVAYVVHRIVSGGSDSPASSVSHSDVFRHLTVCGALEREKLLF